MAEMKKYVVTPDARLPAAYQHIPIAPYTWELGARLPAQEVSTDRIALVLPHPSLIVSMEATVRPVIFDPVLKTQIDPDDFRVKVDLSETDIITLRRETASSGGGLKGGTVTLGKLASDRRFFMFMLTTDKPNVGFTFQSKYPNGNGIPFDVQIDLTVYGIDRADVPKEWLK